MNKTIVIRTIDDDPERIAIDILRDGYNIVEKTIYDAEELVKPLLNYLEEK